MNKNEQKSITEIQEEIIKSSIQWANEINQGNSNNANKLNTKINKIVFKIKGNQDLSIQILVPLLENVEPTVRLFASVHSLDQGIEVERSLRILRDLADDHSTGEVSIMAYINLKKWKKDNDVP